MAALWHFSIGENSTRKIKNAGALSFKILQVGVKQYLKTKSLINLTLIKMLFMRGLYDLRPSSSPGAGKGKWQIGALGINKK